LNQSVLENVENGSKCEKKLCITSLQKVPLVQGCESSKIFFASVSSSV